MSDYTPTKEDLRELALYGALTASNEADQDLDEAEFQAQLDRTFAAIEREAAARALSEAASSPIPREALANGTRAWLRARAVEIREKGQGE